MVVAVVVAVEVVVEEEVVEVVVVEVVVERVPTMCCPITVILIPRSEKAIYKASRTDMFSIWCALLYSFNVMLLYYTDSDLFIYNYCCC